MSTKFKIVGVGAAGNKAVITMIEKDICDKNSVLLLNSTLRDIPEQYRSLAVQYANTRGGAGKERMIAKTLCLQSIQDGELNCLDKLVTDEDELVVLVASSEGGTGSGSLPILAKYFTQVLGKVVHCVVFTGFEEDSRGLQNTIELFQEIEGDYAIQVISNKKFLDTTNNKLKAEKVANEELANKIAVLVGKDIIESEQNIDETDLFKASTTPGFMMIESASLDRIKNVNQFNQIVSDMIDNTCSLDSTDKSIKRLAIILNISERTQDVVDLQVEAIKNKLGIPYELFTHVQYDKSREESISIIASGMNMPLDDIKDIYEKYKSQTENMNTNKDGFFEFMKDIKKEDAKAEFLKNTFDIVEPIQPKKEISQIIEDKKDFANQFGVTLKRRSSNPTTNVQNSLNENTNQVRLTKSSTSYYEYT